MRRSWMLALWTLLAPLTPLAALGAGDAYIPLAPNLPLGASTYRTLLIATNTGTATATLAVTFLPNGVDGAKDAVSPSSFPIPAGSTLRLYDSVPAGAQGMLMLSGPKEIVVSARIEGLAANGDLLASAQVPIVSGAGATGATAAGQHVELVGLEQSADGAATDFGLVNVGSATAHCTVQASHADASPLGGPVSLSLFPLSDGFFSGALPRLGATSIQDSRFDVTCDQPFSTYALVYRSGGPETVAMGPAARLDSDLVPDVPVPVPPVPDDGSLHFDLPGPFANGTTYATYDLPLANGTLYGKAHVEFDLYLDRWHTAFPNNPNYESVASFRRSATKRVDRVLYWGLILKGSGDFRTLLDLGLAPGSSEGTTLKSGKGPWQEQTLYHLAMDYDAVAGTVLFQAFQGGNLVQEVTGPINNSDITNLPNEMVRVDFSSVGVGDGAYFPTTGWKYSNLSIQLTPRQGQKTAAPPAPVAGGDLLLPLAAGSAPDGTTYATRVWITNTGASTRRLTSTFIAAGADGTKATANGSVSILPGATVLGTGLSPAGQSGMLLVTGAPQLLVTTRLEAVAPDGSLRAAVAGPVVKGHQLGAANATLELHGLSQKEVGLSTDLHVLNAAQQATKCTLDAFHFDGTRIAPTISIILAPLSVRVFEKALVTLGVTDIDEARFAVSCDQAFYTYARVYKPGGGELNLMTPSAPLGQAVSAPATP
jgi:hypothetical protein